MTRHRAASTVRTFPTADGLLALDTVSSRLFAYNGTAREVWDLMAEGRSADDIAAGLAARYGIEHAVAQADVGAILRDWRAHGIVLADGEHAPPPRCTPTPPPADWSGTPRWAAEMTCAIRRKVFAFAVEPADIVLFLDMLFRPLAVAEAPADVRFEIRYAGDGDVALLVNGRERMRSRDHGLVIGAVHQTILEHLHPGIGWLAMAHGGAVARDGAGLAISAASGRGKTTLIAYLSAHGYDYLADDVIALAAPDGRIVPWPLPMSVKAGSWNLLASFYGDLSRFPAFRTARGDLRLITAPDSAWDAQPVPLHSLVFPHHVPDAVPRLTRIRPFEAIERLLRDKVWLGYPMTERRVRAFADWIDAKPAYDVRYGDVADAARCIEDIL